MAESTKTASPRSAAAWHALTVREVESVLETSVNGLSPDAAQERLARFGPNRIEAEIGSTRIALLMRQISSPLVVVLIIASAVMLALDELSDAIVILIVVVLNAIIGFTQERQAERSVSALFELIAPVSTVIRDGTEIEVQSAFLAPGDLVALGSGARVPADLRLTTANRLEVDESALTGESVPVAKHAGVLMYELAVADRTNLVFAGTTVVRGRGQGYVVATGQDTELGLVAAEMRTVEHGKTPLQTRMDALARIVALAVIACSVAAFIGGVLGGRSVSQMFLIAVALAVSAIPEGLPIAFTVALALGVRRMSRRQVIVRHLPAVETLGSTTVIGSDKTGTLTENVMRVRRMWAGGRFLAHDGPVRNGIDMVEIAPVIQTLLTGVLTNEAGLIATEDGWKSVGDPTEAALLIAAADYGIEPDRAQTAWRALWELPFEPERAYSAACRDHDGERTLFVKGSPERVLSMCDAMLDADGSPVPLEAHAVHLAVDELAADGLRVLAMARSRPLRVSTQPVFHDDPDELILCGLQGLADPPRASVHEAIAQCQAAGIRVVMITGDHAATALAIGRELGIVSEFAGVITGAELSELSEQALRGRIDRCSIFARVSPTDKLRIVQCLQATGQVVAITGDGVNDAPALRGADLGIAMGRRGTDVAREAADMVLADDNFASIVAAVEEGRITHANVRKIVFLLLSANAGEVLTILAALVLNWPLPLAAVQILWLNLVTDSAQAMALATEAGDPETMRRPPVGRTAGILSTHIWRRVGISAVVMATGTLAVFHWQLDRTGSQAAAQTAALTTMVFFQLLQAMNARSETRSIFKLRVGMNHILIVAIGLTLLLHGTVVGVGSIGTFLRIRPLDLTAWLICFIAACSIVVAVEIHKWIGSRR